MKILSELIVGGKHPTYYTGKALTKMFKKNYGIDVTFVSLDNKSWVIYGEPKEVSKAVVKVSKMKLMETKGNPILRTYKDNPDYVYIEMTNLEPALLTKASSVDEIVSKIIKKLLKLARIDANSIEIRPYTMDVWQVTGEKGDVKRAIDFLKRDEWVNLYNKKFEKNGENITVFFTLSESLINLI